MKKIVVIEILAISGFDTPPFPLPAWIQECNKEEGIVICHTIDEAKKFKSLAEGMEFWKKEYPQGVLGQNPAGPNRPLTAFTVNVYDVRNPPR